MARSILLVLAAASLAVACGPTPDSRVAKTPVRPVTSAQSPGTPVPPESPPDPRVDEIIAKYIAAKGGLDKLRAITSLRATAKNKFGFGDTAVEAQMAYETKRGGKTRSEVTIQGMTAVDAFDGTTAWAVEPFGGRREPFRKAADDAKRAADGADMDGPLVDWRAKGHRVDYLGTEDVEGSPAIKLRVRLKDGDIEYYFLDPDAYLEVRTVSETRTRGVEEAFYTDYGDYEQVAGVWMAAAMRGGPKGQPPQWRSKVEKVEVNAPIDDAVFAFPAPGTRVTASIVLGPGAVAPSSAGAPPPAAAGGEPVFDRGVLSGMRARNIGSAQMSGRVSAVAGRIAGGKTLLYVGAASGGVWKSEDGGTIFKPVFDKQPVQSIGAIAIDPQDPQTVWVGTGESWTRNSVSIGNGIYRSTDGGATWKNMGLPESERITRILVDPRSKDVVYACVPGKLWSDSADRGLYKTTDGGATWQLVLKGDNLSTGCSGLAMDPKNPDVLFAGTWDFRRKGWTYRSGGDTPDSPSASSLFRTADGGKTWTKLAGKDKGLPDGPWGRVEVAVAPSDANVVYAFIESKSSALYRSGDGGATWERRDDSNSMVWRPFYFARLVVDPTDANHLFKPDGALVVSEDGGKSFAYSGGGTHGDSHDVWIDPTNPKHVVVGDDGGLWTSWDGGSRWWKSQNLPISQFYHVSVDAEDPYHVYGGLQDNSSWVGDSSYPGGVTNSRWENLFNGDGFWVFPDPSDSEWVYAEYQGGLMGRVNRKTLASRVIQPMPNYGEKLRFNWNTPIHVSPTQRGVVYIGGQFLFRSKDHGDSWERVSPDLTTNDKEKQKQEESGGVTVDNSSAEMHTTIFAISESPLDAKVVWVGTDDGKVQLTRDGTRTWTDLTANVAGLPPFSWVSSIEASRYAAGSAYATFDRHTFGDMDPWVYKTTDYGKTWTRIVAPDKGVRGYAHVVKEDSVDPNLLFVGTEFGLWVSIDAGAHWAQFTGSEFPSVAVRDLALQTRDGDLAIATHGRGIWIIDDLSPLRAITPDVLARPVAFLPVRTVQERMPAAGGWPEGDATFAGQNAPGGAVITYYQRARHLFGPLEIQVFDDKGKLVDTVPASPRRGIDRVTWTMDLPPPKVPPAASAAFASTRGPRVLPGTYTIRLTKAGETIETKIEVTLDRRAPYGAADRRAQLDASMKAYALFGDMSTLVNRIAALRAAVASRAAGVPASDPLSAKLAALGAALEAEGKKIVATREGGAITGEERIREHLDQVYNALLSWEGSPAKYLVDRVESLRRELGDVANEVSALVTHDARALDDALKAHNLTPIPDGGEPVAELGGRRGEQLAAAARCAATSGRACRLLPADTATVAVTRD
jgi:photosystem II stability/assembly factor-like uncharacterized protein